MSGVNFTFGPFAFDMDRQLLLKHGCPVVLGQRGAALLGALLQANGMPVTKSELMDAAWPDLHVEESNLSVQIASLRKTLGKAPSGGDWIETVQRNGYRFTETEQTHPAVPDMARNSKPPSVTLAVLPFSNLSSDAEQGFFADGLAEDLIKDLSQVRGLTVIARHSSFKFSEAAQAADGLAARYVISGSVRRSIGRLRITAQLIDTERNANIWAGKFDRELADVFAIQDQTTREIVSAIRGSLHLGEVPNRYHSSSMKAYELCVKSRQLPDRSLDDNRLAYSNLTKAIELDPHYPEPHWQLGATQILWWCLWNGSRDEARTTAFAAATRAVELESNDPDAHETMGFVHMKHSHTDQAFASYSRALELDPNHATTHAAMCDLYMNLSRPTEAVDSIVTALRLNPLPPGWFYDNLGRAQMLAGDYGNAIATLKRVETYGTFSGCFLAGALALSGQMEEAKRESQRFLRVLPHWRIETWIANEFFSNAKSADFWRQAFMKAGLPK